MCVADRVGFWFHALPPEVVALALEDIHELIRSSWLVKYDESIRQEESTRRKGRPPSKREVELKALKQKEEEEYRSGIGSELLLSDSPTSAHRLISNVLRITGLDS